MAALPKSTEAHDADLISDNLDNEHTPRAVQSLELPSATDSPVHGMQAQLVANFAPGDPGYSRRQVYGAVVVFCFSVWLGLYLLVQTIF